jgi:hypothetical protein
VWAANDISLSNYIHTTDTHGRSESRPMHPESWLLIAVLAVIAGYGCLCAYRLAWDTVSDAILLIALTGAAMGAGYLFG